MKRAAVLFAMLSTAAFGQLSPTPAPDDPRLQAVVYEPARHVRLVAFPDTSLTLLLLPGDRVQRVVLSDPSAFDVKVVGLADSLSIQPLRSDAKAGLAVETSQRRYDLDLETGRGLMAAYLVRFTNPVGPTLPFAPQAPGPPPNALRPALTGEYRLSGDQALQPSKIGDDGERTYIEWGKYQSLPAVLGIGTAGQEEVVDGYMRSGVFTIDRVYPELVFRIDNKHARARRRTGLG